jgi:hypothetical protein
MSESSKSFWKDREKAVLRCAVLLMSCSALVWLGYEFWRFFAQPEMLFGRPVVTGGIDLKLLQGIVHGWFSGMPIYSMSRFAVYPPASHLIAWPLVGWLGYAASSLLWTAVTLLSLALLVMVFVRESRARSPLERVFAGLMPLAAYPAGAVIGNGQLTIVVIASVVSCLLLLTKCKEGWGTDLAAAVLFLTALVKPHVSAPFFWIAFFAPGRVRPALLIAGGYCAMTIVAVSWQDAGTITLMTDWLANSTKTTAGIGYAHLHIISALIPFTNSGLLGSMLAMGVLGAFVYSCRRADIWLLIGVTALIARFWTYHQWYDDLLILLPLIALFRVAKSAACPAAISMQAGSILGACMVLMLAPGGHFTLPSPWLLVYQSALVAVWLIMLAFLVRLTWQGRKIVPERAVLLSGITASMP